MLPEIAFAESENGRMILTLELELESKIPFDDGAIRLSACFVLCLALLIKVKVICNLYEFVVARET